MKEMKLVNLTPHDLIIVMPDGKNMTIPASGSVARIACETHDTGKTINGIPVTHTTYTDPMGLPQPEKDTIYIVSLMVAERVPERADVMIVNEAVRNDRGQIIGCRSLAHV